MQLPAPTDQQLMQAFEALAIRDRHLARMTFTAAMQDPVWRRVIRLRACLDRKKAYEAATARKVQLVRRCNPATGKWCTQRVPGAYDDSQPNL